MLKLFTPIYVNLISPNSPFSQFLFYPDFPVLNSLSDQSFKGGNIHHLKAQKIT